MKGYTIHIVVPILRPYGTWISMIECCENWRDHASHFEKCSLIKNGTESKKKKRKAFKTSYLTEIITVPDVLAPFGARASACIVITNFGFDICMRLYPGNKLLTFCLEKFEFEKLHWRLTYQHLKLQVYLHKQNVSSSSFFVFQHGFTILVHETMKWKAHNLNEAFNEHHPCVKDKSIGQCKKDVIPVH